MQTILSEAVPGGVGKYPIVMGTRNSLGSFKESVESILKLSGLPHYSEFASSIPFLQTFSQFTLVCKMTGNMHAENYFNFSHTCTKSTINAKTQLFALVQKRVKISCCCDV